jgi:hypothetical protein
MVEKPLHAHHTYKAVGDPITKNAQSRSREMDRQAQKRRDMELDLYRAFANGEFELPYQPLVDIAAAG